MLAATLFAFAKSRTFGLCRNFSTSTMHDFGSWGSGEGRGASNSPKATFLRTSSYSGLLALEDFFDPRQCVALDKPGTAPKNFKQVSCFPPLFSSGCVFGSLSS